jgi:hypothetical protein
MNSQELRALQEAYSQVYELDEVHGIDGHINPNTGKSSYGLDSGLAMTPKKRMETRANSLQKKGEGKRANKIRAVMKRPSMEEEVENWVNSLIEEGYDLSEYSWDDMYEMYVTEGDNYDKNRKRAAQRAAARNAARDAGQTGAVPGVGYVTSRRESETYRDSAGTERHKTGARMPKKDVQKEQVDLFDTILEYLVAEGYADTNESALVIMANMSEEWRESIVEATYKPSGSAAPTDTPADTRMTVTAADKAGNTKAYQSFKAGDPAYKAASHLKGV